MDKQRLVIVGCMFEYKREGYAKSFDLAMRDFVVQDGVTLHHAKYLKIMRDDIEKAMGTRIEWVPNKCAVRVLPNHVLKRALGLRTKHLKAATAAGVRVLRLHKSKRKHLSKLGGIQNGEKISPVSVM